MFSYELCINAFCDAFIPIKVEKCPNIFFYFCVHPWKGITALKKSDMQCLSIGTGDINFERKLLNLFMFKCSWKIMLR